MELRDHLRMLGLHWVGVLLIVALSVAAAAAYTFTQPKVYAADSIGFVSTGSASNPALGSIQDELAKSRATSYVDIAKSRATAQQAIDDLGLDAEPSALVGQISVEQPLDTVLIRITARDDTPEGAQQLADAWVSALAVQVQRLEDPQENGRPGIPRVVPYELADVPTSPVSPNPPRNLALGLAAGLVLGYGYALLRHTLDRRLRSPQTVESRFGVPVVGTVPMERSLDHDHGQERPQVVLATAEGSGRQRVASEAFRKLRTNLIFMDVDNPPRAIVVTSPRPGDGKSTVAANLAAAVALSGQPVVLVDGDLRRPTVATSLGVDEGIGLTEVLVGRVGLDDVLQEAGATPHLWVLPAGRIPPNPSELVGSKAMRSLIASLAERFLVIIDAPPLLPVTDAAILTAGADGALVVISYGRTVDTELEQALSHLQAVNARALGIIMNRTKRRGGGGYYYYDAAYYGTYEPAQDTPARGTSKRGGGKRGGGKRGFGGKRRTR